MKKKIFMIFVLAAVTAGAMVYSAFASTNVSWDFEDGQTPSWTAIYNNASMAIETESDGNHYLRLSYNGNANRDREYYDVKVTDISSNDTLQVDYDIMYSENDTEKDGELQIKKRTGPGSSESTMVSRIGKNMAYFRLQNESNSISALKDLSGETLEIEVGHWYSVKIIVDTENCQQSVYVFDRDTQELLSYTGPITTIDGNSKINMVTFSSGTDMCLDNVKVYNTAYVQGAVYGSPYVSAATKNKYYLFGKNSDGTYTALPDGDTVWTLLTPRTGVSVDSDTARIIVGSKPEPGPIIIEAERTTEDGDVITAQYVVNVSN